MSVKRPSPRPKRPTKDIYLAFANWRFQTQHSHNLRQSIFFFRSSFDHSLVWTLVMRGHYKNAAPSVRDCQNVAKCSRLTTRKLLADGVAQGFLFIHAAPNDNRKRLVHPTALAIAEYEAMVRRYVGLGETLIADKRRIKTRRAERFSGKNLK